MLDMLLPLPSIQRLELMLMLLLEGKADCDCFDGLKLMHIIMIMLLWRLRSAAKCTVFIMTESVCVQVEEEIGRS